jgi:hypothetical protein
MTDLAVTLIACAACADAPSSIPRPAATARTEIIGGVPSDASQDFVIVMADLEDPSGLECNAVLVAPNLVVTARHCVAMLDDTHVLSCNVSGGVGSSPTVNGDYPALHFSFWQDAALTESLPVRASQVFDSNATTLCGEDIAFLLLDQNLTSLPVATLSTTFPAMGDTLTVVGSGDVDDAGTPATVRMQRSGVTVVGVGPTAVPATGHEEAVLAGEFATGVAFCNGDSGGPAIDAHGLVTGIVSRTPSCTSGPDVFTSVAAHLDVAQQAFAAAGITFPPVDAGAADASEEAGDAEPTSPASSGCVMAPSPSPATWGGWLVLVALLFVTSRRVT